MQSTMQPLLSIIMDENKESSPHPDSPQQTRDEKMEAWLARAFATSSAVLLASGLVYSILCYNDIVPAFPAVDPSNGLNNQSITNSNFANQLALYSLCQALLRQHSTGNTSTVAGGVSGENSLVCTQLLEMIDMSQLVAQAFPGLVLPTSTAGGSPGALSLASTAIATSNSGFPPSSGTGPSSSGAPLISTPAGAILVSLTGGAALIVLIWLPFRFRQSFYSHYPRE